MTVSKTREKLTSLVDEVADTMGEIFITKNGQTKAVLMSAEERLSWEETIYSLSNPETMKAIREADKDYLMGRTVSFEHIRKSFE